MVKMKAPCIEDTDSAGAILDAFIGSRSDEQCGNAGELRKRKLLRPTLTGGAG